jgi:hypothetical protein
VYYRLSKNVLSSIDEADSLVAKRGEDEKLSYQLKDSAKRLKEKYLFGMRQGGTTGLQGNIAVDRFCVFGPVLSSPAHASPSLPVPQI